MQLFTVDDPGLDDIDAYHLAPNYVLFVGTSAGAERVTPMLALTPQTEDAGIEDLRARIGWRKWDLGLPSAPRSGWEVRVRRADRTLTGIVCTDAHGDEAAVELWRAGEEGRITTGRGGRYLIADLDAMASEADGEQYVTAQVAATDVLEIRASNWRYVEAAGWITPARTYEKEVGRRTVTVALYRLGDVRALRDLPGVDWEAMRGLPKGAPSPLREYAKLAPTRAAAVRGFAQGLADRHGITV
ncbi:hypothetical protein ABZ871_32440 [Streptomyces populi]